MFKGISEKAVYVYLWIIQGFGAKCGEILFKKWWSTSHTRHDLGFGEVKSIVQKVQLSELQYEKTRACAV